MATSAKKVIDLSIFDHAQDLSQESCTDLNDCHHIKRILTFLKYYSLLQVSSNQDDQNIFINFINTIYTVSDLIMDNFHLQKKHGQEINQIMDVAMSQYKFQSCDLQTCPYSSRLYRANDKSAELNIFDEDDKESVLQVVMDIIDGIHHYVFHVFECGLRDIGDTKSDNDDFIDDEYKGMDSDQLYDLNYARMSNRISKTRSNTERFDRLHASKKFNIIVDCNDVIDHESDDTKSTMKHNCPGKHGLSKFNTETDAYGCDGCGEALKVNQELWGCRECDYDLCSKCYSSISFEDLTFLDSIFTALTKAEVDQTVMKKLANYLLIQMFDTEALDIDVQIEEAGNVENSLENKECIDIIKNMFAEATSYVLKSCFDPYIDDDVCLYFI